MTVTHVGGPTPPGGGSGWRRAAARVLPVLRGLLAVVVLVIGAADEAVTAVIGVPPALPRTARTVRRLSRRLGTEFAAAFRGGRDGVMDAEVIDDDARRWR
jgi:hypothetical protein